MKKHAIIPIFIPHKGCRNDCVFCNQRKITARLEPPKPEDLPDLIESHLKTIVSRQIETIEIAFFGGSFTGLPMEEQASYLRIASHYKQHQKIHKIRLSTRPDYIDEKNLTLLKQHHVDIIELGAQSFDDEVLRQSNRGHSAEKIYQSAMLIQSYGFELGIQLMSGLPGDTYEKSIFSARKTVEIGPSISRIYPTVVIQNTPLYQMYINKTFQLTPLNDSVKCVKDMYTILTKGGVNVIRIGLKSSENTNKAYGFHPAFRHLVDSEIALDILKEKWEKICHSNQNLPSHIYFTSDTQHFSNLIGHKKSNLLYFQEKYPDLHFHFKIDNSSSSSELYSIMLDAQKNS